MSRAPSPEQMAYINGLISRVVEVTDTPRDIDIDADKITRSEASAMINGLLKALDRLNGHLSESERRKLVFEGTYTYSTKYDDPRPAMTDRQKQNAGKSPTPHTSSRVVSTERAQIMERAIAYNEAQQKLFPNGPKPPTYRDKLIVVWQRNPHHMSPYTGAITCGWAWECNSLKHSKRVMGSSMIGYQECMDNAMKHWNTYHAEGWTK